MRARERLGCWLRLCLRLPLFLALLLAARADGQLRRALGWMQPGPQGAVWMHRWCRRILWGIGLEYAQEGLAPESGAVVCNHLSYLDIVLMSAIQPFVMVAKREVRAWPLIGWLTAQAGTVYVTRGGAPATYPAVNAAMAEAYATGLPVLFFPEGTTTDGSEVVPFRRGLFHSVLNGGVPLRVAALRYAIGERNAGATVADQVCWWGEATFAPHLLRFLGLGGVSARVVFGPEIRTRRDRFELASTSREQIEEMYRELEFGAEACVDRSATTPRREQAGLLESA